jgi:hypothetical protein
MATSSPTAVASSSRSSTPVGAIAGGVVGGVVGAVTLFLLFFLVRRRRRHNSRWPASADYDSEAKAISGPAAEDDTSPPSPFAAARVSGESDQLQDEETRAGLAPLPGASRPGEVVLAYGEERPASSVAAMRKQIEQLEAEVSRLRASQPALAATIESHDQQLQAELERLRSMHFDRLARDSAPPAYRNSQPPPPPLSDPPSPPM